MLYLLISFRGFDPTTLVLVAGTDEEGLQTLHVHISCWPCWLRQQLPYRTTGHITLPHHCNHQFQIKQHCDIVLLYTLVDNREHTIEYSNSYSYSSMNTQFEDINKLYLMQICFTFVSRLNCSFSGCYHFPHIISFCMSLFIGCGIWL